MSVVKGKCLGGRRIFCEHCQDYISYYRHRKQFYNSSRKDGELVPAPMKAKRRRDRQWAPSAGVPTS